MEYDGKRAVGGKWWPPAEQPFVLFVSSVVNSYPSRWILACARMTEGPVRFTYSLARFGSSVW